MPPAKKEKEDKKKKDDAEEPKKKKTIKKSAGLDLWSGVADDDKGDDDKVWTDKRDKANAVADNKAAKTNPSGKTLIVKKKKTDKKEKADDDLIPSSDDEDAKPQQQEFTITDALGNQLDRHTVKSTMDSLIRTCKVNGKETGSSSSTLKVDAPIWRTSSERFTNLGDFEPKDGYVFLAMPADIVEPITIILSRPADVFVFYGPDDRQMTEFERTNAGWQAMTRNMQAPVTTGPERPEVRWRTQKKRTCVINGFARPFIFLKPDFLAEPFQDVDEEENAAMTTTKKGSSKAKDEKSKLEAIRAKVEKDGRAVLSNAEKNMWDKHLEKEEALANAGGNEEFVTGDIESTFSIVVPGGDLDPPPAGDAVVCDGFSLSAPGQDLFVNTNLKLVYGHKYGLMGPNGKGKTTLLRHLAARKFPVPLNWDVLLVEQEVKASDRRVVDEVLSADTAVIQLMTEESELMEKFGKVERGELEMEATEMEATRNRLAAVTEELEAMDADGRESEVRKILSGLGFSDEAMERGVRVFSGGWRMRISLAKALFLKPKLLLLDEPTNHLDLDAVLWLDEYLAERYPHAVMIVSHDADFLDSVCTDIVHLEDKKLNYYRGNYSSFREMHKQKQRENDKEWKVQQDEIKRLMKSGKNKQQAEEECKKKFKVEHGSTLTQKSKDYLVKFTFRGLGQDRSIGGINMSDVAFSYDGKEPYLLEDVDIGVDCASRIAMVGPNGAGKSTILNIMLQCDGMDPLKGDIYSTPGLRIRNYSQHFEELIPLDKSPVAYLMEDFNLPSPEQACGILGQYGLAGASHLTLIGNLSGGQKARVAFAALMLSNPHIIILDEPTNHLDIESVEALTEALRNFDGGLVLVTHDARLIQSLDCVLYVCDEGTCWNFGDAGFEGYRDRVLDTVTRRVEEAEMRMKERTEAKRTKRRELLGSQYKEVEKTEEEKQEDHAVLEKKKEAKAGLFSKKAGKDKKKAVKQEEEKPDIPPPSTGPPVFFKPKAKAETKAKPAEPEVPEAKPAASEAKPAAQFAPPPPSRRKERTEAKRTKRRELLGSQYKEVEKTEEEKQEDHAVLEKKKEAKAGLFSKKAGKDKKKAVKQEEEKPDIPPPSTGPPVFFKPKAKAETKAKPAEPEVPEAKPAASEAKPAAQFAPPPRESKVVEDDDDDDLDFGKKKDKKDKKEKKDKKDKKKPVEEEEEEDLDFGKKKAKKEEKKKKKDFKIDSDDEPEPVAPVKEKKKKKDFKVESDEEEEAPSPEVQDKKKKGAPKPDSDDEERDSPVSATKDKKKKKKGFNGDDDEDDEPAPAPKGGKAKAAAQDDSKGKKGKPDTSDAGDSAKDEEKAAPEAKPEEGLFAVGKITEVEKMKKKGFLRVDVDVGAGAALSVVTTLEVEDGQLVVVAKEGTKVDGKPVKRGKVSGEFSEAAILSWKQMSWGVSDEAACPVSSQQPGAVPEKGTGEKESDGDNASSEDGEMDDEVKQWLESVGMSKAVDAFSKNELGTFDALKALLDDDDAFDEAADVADLKAKEVTAFRKALVTMRAKDKVAKPEPVREWLTSVGLERCWAAFQSAERTELASVRTLLEDDDVLDDICDEAGLKSKDIKALRKAIQDLPSEEQAAEAAAVAGDPVEEWLNSVEMGKCLEAFRAAGRTTLAKVRELLEDEDALDDLSDEANLKAKEAKQLRKAIEALPEEAAAPAAEAQEEGKEKKKPTDPVGAWLDAIELADELGTFKRYNIKSMDDLSKLSIDEGRIDDLVDECGMSAGQVKAFRKALAEVPKPKDEDDNEGVPLKSRSAQKEKEAAGKSSGLIVIGEVMMVEGMKKKGHFMVDVNVGQGKPLAIVTTEELNEGDKVLVAKEGATVKSKEVKKEKVAGELSEGKILTISEAGWGSGDTIAMAPANSSAGDAPPQKKGAKGGPPAAAAVANDEEEKAGGGKKGKKQAKQAEPAQAGGKRKKGEQVLDLGAVEAEDAWSDDDKKKKGKKGKKK
eukprot:CAMPEP_0204506546 /NCGR_PEP_ID=MMETSP0471-20130131/109302_1 /ASSEMBLY_ACC=CAM_ASM_000602 /TAXON_ID=2969 /ORGANISM="Oxyrrhis marina" /LENGTH=1976 /DNA_ID=CAMNT_0051511551 /DNA_START=126 /DNA_END=6057 /DNA_ORIENTATION=-